MTRRILLGLAFASSLAALSCTESTICTLRDCVSGFRTQFALPLTCAEWPELTITACRNESCATGVPECRLVSYGNDVYLEVRLEGDVRADGWFYRASTVDGGVRKRSDEWTFQVKLFVWPHERSSLNDGDRYTVDIVRTEDGHPVLSYEKVVSYERWFPNGRDCDGAQGYCLMASDGMEGWTR